MQAMDAFQISSSTLLGSKEAFSYPRKSASKLYTTHTRALAVKWWLSLNSQSMQRVIMTTRKKGTRTPSCSQ